MLAEREKSLEGREVLVSRKEAAINEIIEKRGVMLDEVEQHIGNLYSSFEDCIEKKIKRMEVVLNQFRMLSDCMHVTASASAPC